MSGRFVPLTRAQHGVWAAQRLVPEATAFRIGQLVWLDGEIDAAVFADAAGQAFAESEALRTRFTEVDGTAYQSIDEDASLPTTVVDEPAGDDAIRRRVRAAYRAVIDVTEPSRSESALFRRDGGGWAWAFTTHHLVLDAYGLSLFTRRVAEIYTARLDGAAPGARWFGSWPDLVGSGAAPDADHRLPGEWTSLFEDAEPLGHAADVPVDELFVLSEQQVDVPLPAGVWDRMQDRARRARVSWAAYLTGLWGVYTALGENRPELIVRVPFMMREGAAALRTPGMLVNSLPVVARLSGASSLDELVAGVARQLRTTSRDRNLTEEEVAREWPGGALDYLCLPLINIKAFDYTARFGEVSGRQETVNAGPVGRLELVVYSDPVHGSRLDLAGHESLIGAAELAEHAERFASFVSAALDRDAGIEIAALPAVMTPAEQAVLDECGAGVALEVPDSTLDGLIREQVAATPDEVAVIDDDGVQVTYAQFDARVNATARTLIDRGVAIGDRVAVILPRSVDLIVTLAAVMRAGAAFVPIDPSYPTGRIQTILQDAAPTLVIDEPLPGTTGNPVLTRPLSPHDTAYVIFTSGTTGRPKGVAVPHRAIVNLIAWRWEIFPIAVADRVLQKTSVGFDVAVPEFFWPLTVGATVRLVRPGGERDPEYLTRILRDEPIAFVDLVPTALQAMLDTGFDPAATPVRHLSVGGEALPAALGRRLQDVPGVNVWNNYGPTETAVDATGTSLADVDLTRVPVVPIGRPIANVRAVVLDAWLRPTAPGVAGELYLGGVQLADGYVGRPGLTAERFIADDDGRRLYRTGDLVAWNDRGGLEFLGRVDDQVKIRGYRIELDEIRNVLEDHEGVSAAAVIALDHPAGGKYLAAYVITSAPVEELRARAEARLPDYMVPTTFTRLDSLPVTANGKLDQRALPVPDLGGGPGRAPRTRTEQILAEVFRDVLQVPSVTVDDDFFRLGGDSILSIQVVSRARRAGVTVTAAEMFTARTVGALARVAEQHDAAAPGESGGPAERSESGLWPIAAAEADLPGFGAFTQSFTFVTPPGLTEPDLHRTLGRVIEHHPALRGRLVRGDGNEWRFETRPFDAEAVGRQTSVDRQTPADRSSSAWPQQIRTVTAELSESLDLTAGVLWRARWFPGDAGSGGRLLWVIHHLVVDGVSWRILGDDLRHAWELETGRTGEPLPPAGTSVPAWTHALTGRSTDTDVTGRLDYWTGVLAGDDPLIGSRPLDPARDTEGTAGTVGVSVPANVTRAVLTDVPDLLSAEVDDVLLGALTIAIGAWRARRGADHRRALVGLEGHGRQESLVPGTDLSRTVGWFTSWFPVALSSDGIDPARALADPRLAADAVLRVKEQLRRVPDRGTGYGLLRHLNPATAPALASGGVPQFGFNYLGQFRGDETEQAAAWGQAPETGGLDVHSPAELPLPAVVDINTAAVPGEGGLVLDGTFSYAASVIGERDVRELVELWTAALAALGRYADVAAHRRRSPSDLTAPGVTQADVDAWEARHGELTDVQPLTALQRGIAFETLLGADDGAVDVYTTQTVLHFDGAVDPDRMRVALDRVLERFPHLKAAIAATGTGELVAVVPASAGTPFTAADAGVPLDEVLDRDRAEPFDLRSAPLTRAVLLTTAPGRRTLVWTMHHILADGWSSPMLIEALLEAYRDPSARPEPDRVYPEFLSWLNARDERASVTRWSRALATVDEPTLVVPGTSLTSSVFPDQFEVRVDPETHAALQRAARSAGATFSSLMQAAWGVVLNSVTGQPTVVFGTAVSGRPAEIDGIEDSVGLFINTVPVPVSVAANPTLGS
ncbi:non-ribosomal peptide synthetase [Actinomadura sp. WMMB 499]|uniref:non-ribosomal peptide synthetase n=1 Tax=Actinomadura sp. WMMB 499 TaxID=1219491 RepID=UPI0012478643|nr:non-ribosomal peptide synthetase [Actinomadura sp. WMMB 499]QFG25320.1 amino acid adenylation domain-containing protein [Actinomadura sp. WMMB 499]